MIESFETVFAAPVEKLTRDEIISILLEDDLDYGDIYGFKSFISAILLDGFIGYLKETDQELQDEYNERRNQALMDYGTDEENGMTGENHELL
jgi:hypothetical protein